MGKVLWTSYIQSILTKDECIEIYKAFRGVSVKQYSKMSIESKIVLGKINDVAREELKDED